MEIDTIPGGYWGISWLRWAGKASAFMERYIPAASSGMYYMNALNVRWKLRKEIEQHNKRRSKL